MKNKRVPVAEIIVIVLVIILVIIVSLPYLKEMLETSKINKYESKIEYIEKQARLYGNEHRDLIIKGMTPLNDSPSTITIKNINENGVITCIELNTNKEYKPTESLNTNEYRGNYITIAELVNEGYLTWDKENQCSNCTDTNKTFYNNVIINPNTNNIINNCYVYIYYKDNTVYSYFDKNTCDQVSDVLTINGKEYKQMNK